MSRLSRGFYIAMGLLLGCAGGEPSRREFRDGAPMRAPPFEPRTTFTPNGAGLPEYWGQPQAEPLPRSPYSRVLPPSREPGLWAADRPKASAMNDDDERRQILGVALPGFEVDEDEIDYGPAMYCAKHWNKVLADKKTAWIFRLEKAKQRCLVGLMLEECVKVPEMWHDAFMRQAGVISMDVKRSLPRMRRAAEDFTNRECDGIRLDGKDLERFEPLVLSYHESVATEIKEMTR